MNSAGWLPYPRGTIGQQWFIRLKHVILWLVLGILGLAALGMLSLKRKEVKSWWAIGVIVLNIGMVLTGILLLSPE
jgi:hypothetical protein